MRGLRTAVRSCRKSCCAAQHCSERAPASDPRKIPLDLINWPQSASTGYKAIATQTLHPRIKSSKGLNTTTVHSSTKHRGWKKESHVPWRKSARLGMRKSAHGVWCMSRGAIPTQVIQIGLRSCTGGLPVHARVPGIFPRLECLNSDAAISLFNHVFMIN